MKLGLIIDDVAYEAPPDLVYELMPILGVSELGDLTQQYLRLSKFREYRPTPHAAVASLVRRIQNDESVRSRMDDAEARKWFDLLIEFWNWAHWRGYQGSRAYAIGYAAVKAANEAVAANGQAAVKSGE